VSFLRRNWSLIVGGGASGAIGNAFGLSTWQTVLVYLPALFGLAWIAVRDERREIDAWFDRARATEARSK
jgi:hypothetical protein